MPTQREARAVYTEAILSRWDSLMFETLYEQFKENLLKESQKPIKYFNREPNERPNSTPDRP